MENAEYIVGAVITVLGVVSEGLVRFGVIEAKNSVFRRIIQVLEAVANVFPGINSDKTKVLTEEK